MDDYQYTPYGDNGKSGSDGLAGAAMACGCLSVALFWLGFLSMPLGALGILFFILSRRRDRALTFSGLAGVVLSLIGMIFGLFLYVVALIILMNDPLYMELLKNPYSYYNNAYHYDMGTINSDF